MKLEDIQEQWRNDSEIDRSELGEASLRIPQLHSKYFNIFSEERLTLRKYESAYKKLYKTKFEYYNGTMSEEELTANGYEPFQLRILKSDINVYMQSDDEINQLELRIEIQKEKVDFLESIIKNLPARGYQINAAISWEKFKVGA
jgi:hypothetical protein